MKRRRNVKKVEIWTDGSCYAKHPKKLGGSGVYIKWKDREYHISRGYSHTSTSRREVGAVLIALRAIRKDLRVTATFYIDSQHVADLLKYKFADWVRGDLYVENQDLWEKIFREMISHPKLSVRVKWIRSHQKDYDNPVTQGNFIADFIANYKNFEKYETDRRV